MERRWQEFMEPTPLPVLQLHQQPANMRGHLPQGVGDVVLRRQVHHVTGVGWWLARLPPQ